MPILTVKMIRQHKLGKLPISKNSMQYFIMSSKLAVINCCYGFAENIRCFEYCNINFEAFINALFKIIHAYFDLKDCDIDKDVLIFLDTLVEDVDQVKPQLTSNHLAKIAMIFQTAHDKSKLAVEDKGIKAIYNEKAQKYYKQYEEKLTQQDKQKLKWSLSFAENMSALYSNTLLEFTDPKYHHNLDFIVEALDKRSQEINPKKGVSFFGLMKDEAGSTTLRRRTSAITEEKITSSFFQQQSQKFKQEKVLSERTDCLVI